MITDMLKTEEITLRAEPEKEVTEGSSVTIARFKDELSTNSSAPNIEENTLAGTSDPVPVSGYALEEHEKEFRMTDEDKVTPEDDGRYAIVRESINEVVIDVDQRDQVHNTSNWPWRVHGHIEMVFPNGKRYIGSGTMINQHHVLTAGHVVYSRNDGGWATQVIFQAARNAHDLPFGTVNAVRLLSVTGWTDNNDSRFDMGMLILDRNLGNDTGWLGVITGRDDLLLRHRVNVSGYPGDKGDIKGTELWTMADVIKAVQAERLYYDIDTAGGQSGNGVWSSWNGHPGEKVCAIHTTGALSGNGATRISRSKFDRIVDWLARY